ncbi:helix-turn-helix domain-containing protein [Peribacillus frigoritolerans]|uniref:helix-turn-helix domain-containing protein n=1 Tax=Peribacillus frigoritolerans TaxID=450367 RepID=UPI003DA05D57
MLDMKSFGKIIQKKRKELGFTQTQVSEATELSRNYISDIENGRYTPSIDSLSKIAVYLGIDLNIIKMTEIQVVEECSIDNSSA